MSGSVLWSNRGMDESAWSCITDTPRYLRCWRINSANSLTPDKSITAAHSNSHETKYKTQKYLASIQEPQIHSASTNRLSTRQCHYRYSTSTRHASPRSNPQTTSHPWPHDLRTRRRNGRSHHFSRRLQQMPRLLPKPRLLRSR